MVRQGPCPGPASSSSPSGWPAARASLFRAPHTEVTFSDTHASPSRGPWFSRPVLGAAAVAASAARSWGRVMKRAGRVGSVGLVRFAPEAWSRFGCGPLRGPCRFGSALRLRAARPRLWFVRASRRRPRCSRARVVKKEAAATRGSWSVVRIVAPVLRAPASPSARARLGSRLRGAWWASAFLS